MTNTVDQDILYAAIGQRIRDLRNGRGLTQAQLAESLSLSRTSVTNIESGRQKLLVHTLVEIATVLGVSVSSLLPTMTIKRTSIAESLLKDMNEADRRFVTGIVPTTAKEDTPWPSDAVESDH